VEKRLTIEINNLINNLIKLLTTEGTQHVIVRRYLYQQSLAGDNLIKYAKTPIGSAFLALEEFALGGTLQTAVEFDRLAFRRLGEDRRKRKANSGGHGLTLFSLAEPGSRRLGEVG
jgi:hypothetical protein